MTTEKEWALQDYWRVLWNYRKAIIIVFCAVEVITLIVSAAMPKTYRSTASVLPPEIAQEGLTRLVPFRLDTQLPDLFAGSSTSDTIIAMLKSRRMAEDVIKEFNLREVYRKKYLVDAVKALRDNTRISKSKEGVISIRVASRKRELAAKIANFYVANLNTMNDELELTSNKPIVRVLDVAKPAEKKWKPSIRQNLKVVGLITLMVTVFAALARERLLILRKGR